MAEIIQLVGETELHQMEINKQVVQALEKLLDLANEGRLQAVMVCGLLDDETNIAVSSNLTDTHKLSMIGLIEVAKTKILVEPIAMKF